MTNNPETAPPRSAIWTARSVDRRTPAAVRIPVRTAIHTATWPAATEPAAPSANDRVSHTPSSSAGTGSPSPARRRRP